MDIRIIMKKLKFMDDPYLEDAFKAAIKNQEQITPELLEVVEIATKQAHDPFGLEDYVLCIHALYLLAHFREKKAFPLVIDLFSTPDDTALELTGNMFVEDLGRILASVYDGNVGLLKAMIENEAVHPLMRASAIESLVVLMAVGEISRDEVVTYYQELFQGRLKRQPSLIWNSLTACVVDIHPEELYEEILHCFQDELIDETFIDLDRVDEAMEIEREEALENLLLISDYSLIDDVVQEIRYWSGDHLEEEA